MKYKCLGYGCTRHGNSKDNDHTLSNSCCFAQPTNQTNKQTHKPTNKQQQKQISIPQNSEINKKWKSQTFGHAKLIYDTQCNDTPCKDTQRNDTQRKDTHIIIYTTTLMYDL